ncbi:hypothetical protein GQ43DRAFT_471475 [Delitschia confertaspora ATCC 74209]|uniref:Uncharacterized protein n=1 Tax=Delitschia confertaspora ATCC 74209 TaxID=1513339 RepID=A0A9P4MZE5_9PLEO|nr:hypothetical protein GQ43DRAFT_471475 [Delitschia confertaspora ATCC 74209]
MTKPNRGRRPLLLPQVPKTPQLPCAMLFYSLLTSSAGSTKHLNAAANCSGYACSTHCMDVDENPPPAMAPPRDAAQRERRDVGAPFGNYNGNRAKSLGL